MVSALTCDLYLQAAQVVLIALFELNTPEFTMLLGALPKTFQDGATKLLHNHLKNSSNTSSGVVSPAKFPWYVMSDLPGADGRLCSRLFPVRLLGCN